MMRLFALAFLLLGMSVSAQTSKPNILLLYADDMGYGDLGIQNPHSKIPTPYLDQLAREGMRFTDGHSSSGICTPSRYAMLTGRHHWRKFHGIVNVLGTSVFEKEEWTLPEMLQKEGYTTACIGKWHLGRKGGMAPHEQGFNQSLLMADGLYLPADDPNVVNARLEFDGLDQFLWAKLGFANSFNSGDEDRFEPAGYLTDYWTDESIKIIKANRNRPFFLYLAHWGVHTPLQATREDYEAVGDIQPHRLRVYAAMVRAIDRSVGRINAVLEAEGLAENTIVVFTSDNGGAGYIGLPGVNQPLRGWKMTNFEGGLRVPLFMKWPARIKAGTISEEPVAHIDMMPTLAAAAQASTPEGVDIDGLNLLPLATTESKQDWDRQTLFWQSGNYRVVRHGDWKLQVAERPDGGPWLHNLAVDPSEQNNLASSHPEKLAELMALLDAHQMGAREPLYPSAVEAVVTLDKTLAERFEDGDEYIYWPN